MDAMLIAETLVHN